MPNGSLFEAEYERGAHRPPEDPHPARNVSPLTRDDVDPLPFGSLFFL